MPTEDKSISKDSKPWWRRIIFDFYYVEQVGSRYYLRITPFSLILMIVSLIIFFIYLLGVLWYDSYKQANNNINIPAASQNKQIEMVVTPSPSPSAPESHNR
jgi:hypothetical protein